MVNELDRWLELCLACGRADMSIATGIIADTGHGKSYRLRQFAEQFTDCVYYVPANTTAYKAREAIRDMHGYLDMVIIDDFSWIPDYDKHAWASLLRELFDKELSKDSKDSKSRIKKIAIHASLVTANNEKTLRSRFIDELDNQGVTDRFIPFRYTHSKETNKYIRQMVTRGKNKYPIEYPQLEFRDIPKDLTGAYQLDDKEVDYVAEKYLRCRYADQVIGVMRIAYELDYQDILPDIFRFIDDKYHPMDVKFRDVKIKDKIVIDKNNGGK